MFKLGYSAIHEMYSFLLAGETPGTSGLRWANQPAAVRRSIRRLGRRCEPAASRACPRLQPEGRAAAAAAG